MRGRILLIGAVAAALMGSLLVYSQTLAFVWDEGFHLLAAQLILRGKRPYLDFCFPQTPLNAYWNAAWMRILGQSWRAAHAVAAATTAGAVWLSADYLHRRFPDPAWRLPAALAGALLIGLNCIVLEFGTIAQAYALCLLLTVAAFRAAVLAVELPGPAMTATAGSLAACAVASSLLTASEAPVLLAWILLRSRPGQRLSRFAAFAAGAAVPFLPLAWLYVKGPRQTLFNLVEYQLRYRRTNWEDATPHDIEVLTSWLTSPHALILVILAVAGLVFVARSSGWKSSVRSEWCLPAWLALAIGVELCATHPTFRNYWVLIVPFCALPAAAGFYAIASRVYPATAPSWSVAALALLLSVGLAKSVYDSRGSMRWKDLESIARKVQEVTPASGKVWGDEAIYFLTRRPPIEGTEFSYTEVIEISPEMESLLHVATEEELDRGAAAGAFATVSLCDDAEVIEELDLAHLYRHSAKIRGCSVFWEPAKSGPSPTGPRE